MMSLLGQDFPQGCRGSLARENQQDRLLSVNGNATNGSQTARSKMVEDGRRQSKMVEDGGTGYR
ncbi:MAG TPA: hypothetical protein VFO95_10915, partial [Gemmatimonadales bacterium]|nr:hypothetical protein [Gemmatimonadales bacterium]